MKIFRQSIVLKNIQKNFLLSTFIQKGLRNFLKLSTPQRNQILFPSQTIQNLTLNLKSLIGFKSLKQNLIGLNLKSLLLILKSPWFKFKALNQFQFPILKRFKPF
jgi:hypothetical protein